MNKVMKSIVVGILTVGILAGIAPTEGSAKSYKDYQKEISNEQIFKGVFTKKWKLPSWVKEKMNVVKEIQDELSKRP